MGNLSILTKWTWAARPELFLDQIRTRLAWIALVLLTACGERRMEVPVQSGSSSGAQPDTNTIRALWDRELSRDAEVLHKEGVEEFLGIVTFINNNSGGWLRSESEIAFFSGRALVAISKLSMKNELDRLAYRKLVALSFFGREHSTLAETGYHWGDLTILETNSVSYVARRLFYLAQIAWELESRYKFNMAGNSGRILNPTPNHPANKDLLNWVQQAAALFRDAKRKSFRDRTLEDAIKLGIASLQRDNVKLDFNFEAEFFHAHQLYADALKEALDADADSFWINLAILGLGSRGIEVHDCLFHAETKVDLERTISFLRTDLDRCRTATNK